MSRADDVLALWNKRAALGEEAGTQDLIARQLEVRAIAAHVEDGMLVCEWGCGNGQTAIALSEAFDVLLTAVDFSPDMIEAALKAPVEAGVFERTIFYVADVRAEPEMRPPFDLIYTQRMLINLETWEEQKAAIRYMGTLLKPGGKLVLAENSLDGLKEINRLRDAVGLERILSPWHNRYLSDLDMSFGLDLPDFKAPVVDPYSGTYYFLSRVMNALDAKREGREPEYNAEVNRLALNLPSTRWPCAQGKLWVFEKEGADGLFPEG